MLYARVKRGENRRFLDRGDNFKTRSLPKFLLPFHDVFVSEESWILFGSGIELMCQEVNRNLDSHNHADLHFFLGFYLPNLKCDSSL